MGKEVGLLECYNGMALVSTSRWVHFKKFYHMEDYREKYNNIYLSPRVSSKQSHNLRYEASKLTIRIYSQ
jgi:hypothetical protein